MLLAACGRIVTPIYLQRANEHYKKGEWDAAIVDYTRAIELDAKSETAYDGRGKSTSN